MPKLHDITGQRFGRLVALEFVSRATGRTVWRFACDCGAIVEKQARHVTSGGTSSCGCYKLEGNSNRQHGMKGTPEYRTWGNMLSRCRNPKAGHYDDYGGKGISVCERWNDFSNFFADMGPRPSGASIDRIDPSGNYEPGNCRRATATEQCRNRSNTAMITYNGETRPLAEWADIFGVSRHTIGRRLQLGWSTEKALTTPVASTSNRKAA